jgi:hypothetical protein
MSRRRSIPLDGQPHNGRLICHTESVLVAAPRCRYQLLRSLPPRPNARRLGLVQDQQHVVGKPAARVLEEQADHPARRRSPGTSPSCRTSRPRSTCGISQRRPPSPASRRRSPRRRLRRRAMPTCASRCRVRRSRVRRSRVRRSRVRRSRVRRSRVRRPTWISPRSRVVKLDFHHVLVWWKRGFTAFARSGACGLRCWWYRCGGSAVLDSCSADRDHQDRRRSSSRRRSRAWLRQ